MTKIVCSNFVKRQNDTSPFSHLGTDISGRTTTASWRALELHVEECVDEPAKLDATVTPGYKAGVLVVSIQPTFPSYVFYSGVVTVTKETPLVARFAARRDGEAPFLEVLAHGAKTPATRVDVILYSRALMEAEGETVASDVDYEIVSINARTSAEPEPMSPMAMARNFLVLPGGTKAEYTAAQFAEAIIYWSTRTMHGGE